ncbi:uncharacterized protein TrAFT101_006682 [Trichoderma asperellum]|uniref:Carbohydrate-binding module family 13 protein n=1 Tax=Trichoderma asperellum (strain ATCC 204424 / CBS 433.97 / NBRC 101777) TaxID=1042311 RepID=A0A2T3Z1H6_TRIA4|nr:hypothetical protein M441DRAFT_197820 [Trichoderma asperellum CBS 433.97]PTB38661.1 hypothetical protein M441DRAFT_197820 [Trichoderma asperellum CBS 433.97]UKZ91712.1 hypothetical protein TrAFT101_006682 [Trichoderma asperellum]
MAAINTSLIYVLKNSFTAAAKILSQRSDGSLAMVSATNVTSDSLWFLTPSLLPHHYRLHTIANGVQQSLDVINTNGVQSTGLHMTGTGDYSGQYWEFKDSPAGQHYPYRLSNTFTGPHEYLDVTSDTFVAFLSSGDHTGQFWALIPSNTVVVIPS